MATGPEKRSRRNGSSLWKKRRRRNEPWTCSASSEQSAPDPLVVETRAVLERSWLLRLSFVLRLDSAALCRLSVVSAAKKNKILKRSDLVCSCRCVEGGASTREEIGTKKSHDPQTNRATPSPSACKSSPSAWVSLENSIWLHPGRLRNNYRLTIVRLVLVIYARSLSSVREYQRYATIKEEI